MAGRRPADTVNAGLTSVVLCNVCADIWRLKLDTECQRDVELEGTTLKLIKMPPMGWMRRVVGDVESNAVYLTRVKRGVNGEHVIIYFQRWCGESGNAVDTVRPGTTGRILVLFKNCLGKIYYCYGTRWPSGTRLDFTIARSRVRLPPVATVYQRLFSVPSLRGRLLSSNLRATG